MDSSLRIEVERSSGGVLNTDFADDSDAEMFLAHESCMSLVSLTTVDKGCDIIFCAFILFFQGRFLLPHSCGAIAPQLWGSCTTVVGQLHHSCGATSMKQRKTIIWLAGSTTLAPRAGGFGGGSYRKQGTRSVILQRETIQHGVYTNTNIQVDSIN